MNMTARHEKRNITFSWWTSEENCSLLVKLMGDLHYREEGRRFTSETPVNIYQITRRENQEYSKMLCYRHENLNTHWIF
jgi:hypothetical protein